MNKLHLWVIGLFGLYLLVVDGEKQEPAALMRLYMH
jgi:hypothetical protein